MTHTPPSEAAASSPSTRDPWSEATPERLDQAARALTYNGSQAEGAAKHLLFVAGHRIESLLRQREQLHRDLLACAIAIDSSAEFLGGRSHVEFVRPNVPEGVRKLRDDRDAWKHKADTLGGDLNRIRSLVPTASDEQTTFDAVQAELQRLRGSEVWAQGMGRQAQDELVILRQAIGLMTTAKPDMQVDANDPIGMARQVVEVVEQLRAEVERLRAENERFVRCINAIQEPSLPAEAQTAIAAMRDVGPELAKAGIQVGPRCSHAEGVAQLRGERDRWREKFEAVDQEAAYAARWGISTGEKLAAAGFALRAPKEAGLHGAVLEALAELTRLRKESKRDQVAKQQALIDEIARLFPGKGPLIERVKHAAKVDEPQLGLATTKQLLEELQARAEVGGYASYRTVGGEVPNWLDAMRRTEPKRDVALAPIRGLVDEAVRSLFERRSCKEPKVGPATGQPRTEVALAADGSGTVLDLGVCGQRTRASSVP